MLHTQRREFCFSTRWNGPRTSPLEIHMKRKNFVCRDQHTVEPIHFMEKMNALLIEPKELHRDLKRISFPELLPVTYVHVDDEDRSNAPTGIVRCQTESVEKTVSRTIERQHIVSNVHVTVVVDPFRVDRVTVA